jgi:hypothetical protein
VKAEDKKYLEAKAVERGLMITVAQAPINMDAEIVTLSDGKKLYQFGITGLELLQNNGENMKHLLDCRIEEALKTLRKPRFDSVNAPISELAQRAAQS